VVGWFVVRTTSSFFLRIRSSASSVFACFELLCSELLDSELLFSELLFSELLHEIIKKQQLIMQADVIRVRFTVMSAF
jgi:hypothetical protein